MASLTPAKWRRQSQRRWVERFSVADHLDAYFFHSNDFGLGDEYLGGAVEVMHSLKADQVIGAIGMRAPHDFALQRASAAPHPQSRQVERFLHLFDKIRPDVITVRFSLLSRPNQPDETDIFEFARRGNVGVLIKQALGQGTLLRTHHSAAPRRFSVRDHRSKDPMFRPEVLEAIGESMMAVAARYGHTTPDLTRLALRYAMQHDPAAVVLVGFRDERQIINNVTCLGEPLTSDEIAFLRDAVEPARRRLYDLLYQTR